MAARSVSQSVIDSQGPRRLLVLCVSCVIWSLCNGRIGMGLAKELGQNWWSRKEEEGEHFIVHLVAGLRVNTIHTSICCARCIDQVCIAPATMIVQTARVFFARASKSLDCGLVPICWGSLPDTVFGSQLHIPTPVRTLATTLINILSCWIVTVTWERFRIR
ncbi:hypothetical protein GGI43DRAFT_97784 [Trichoderma evansii]